MAGRPKSLDLYPNGLIPKLGTNIDKNVAKEFNTTIDIVSKLRRRLNIPSYISTRCKQQYECPICKSIFYRWPNQIERSNISLCSRECQFEYQKRNRKTFQCDNCGQDVIVKTNEKQNQDHHFCSTGCMHHYFKGENYPKRVWKSGKEHPNFTGGYNRHYGDGWAINRKLVLKRDKTCKNCGKDDHLDMHHIIPHRISKDNSSDNLITLCKSCHSKLGSMYYSNNSEYNRIISEIRQVD